MATDLHQAGVADRDELLELLTEQARRGNVSAIRALLDELRREDGDEDTRSTLDALDNVSELHKRA
jgi:hypothetical protein